MAELLSLIITFTVIGIVIYLGLLIGTIIIGLLSYRSKNHQLAIMCFQINTALTRNSFLPHYYLALALHQAGQVNNSLQHYIRAIELKPDKIEPYHQLAEAYLMINQPEQSLNVLERLLQSNSVNLNDSQKNNLTQQIKSIKQRIVAKN